jgi:hypothetical protein
MSKRAKHPPMNPADLTPEERAELIRKYLADPEAQRRATQRYIDGLVEDARALV